MIFEIRQVRFLVRDQINDMNGAGANQVQSDASHGDMSI